jgi:translation initiation factor 5
LELNPESRPVDEEWPADTSADAVKVQMVAFTACVAGLELAGGVEDESDEDTDSPYTELGSWVEANAVVNAVEVFEKVQEPSIEKMRKAVQVLAQTLFTSDIITEFFGHLPIFQKVCRYLLLPTGKAGSDDRRW